MTTDNSTLDDDAQCGRNDGHVFRNGGLAKAPDTRTAHANNTALLRASTDIGFSAVGAAVSHDKSWVSRFFSDQALVSRAEMLAWLDACNLRIVTPNAESAADAELLAALLKKTSATLQRASNEFQGGDRSLSEDEYRSLLLLAQRGIKAMQEELQ